MEIPRHRLDIRFARSGGPGGQNVNKVESKVEIRFGVDAADWIPAATRERLKELQASRITNLGEFILSSTRHRSQAQNLEECLRKLADILRVASQRPKRRIKTRPTGASRQRRLVAKAQRSEKKQSRSWRGDAD
jgi:protein subunit release factor B